MAREARDPQVGARLYAGGGGLIRVKVSAGVLVTARVKVEPGAEAHEGVCVVSAAEVELAVPAR